jgi:hypothetical protein
VCGTYQGRLTLLFPPKTALCLSTLYIISLEFKGTDSQQNRKLQGFADATFVITDGNPASSASLRHRALQLIDINASRRILSLILESKIVRSRPLAEEATLRLESAGLSAI